jgi:hypothetical protein
MGFDGIALLEAVVGTVIALIALFSSYDHGSLPQRQRPLRQQWASGSSLSPFRSLVRMLNWRRDPAAEQRRTQLEKELALLEWIESDIDLIEADLPSDRTIAANSSDC